MVDDVGAVLAKCLHFKACAHELQECQGLCPSSMDHVCLRFGFSCPQLGVVCFGDSTAWGQILAQNEALPRDFVKIVRVKSLHAVTAMVRA